MRITTFIQTIQQHITASTTPSKPRVIGGDLKTAQTAAKTFEAEEFNRLCQEYKETHGTFFNAEEFARDWEEYKKEIENGNIPRQPVPIKIIPIDTSTIWQKIKEKIGLSGPAQA